MEETAKKKKKVQHLQEQPPTELHSLQPKKWSHGKEDDSYTPPMPPGNEEKKGSCVCVHARARVCVIFLHREVFFQLQDV